MAIKIGTLSFEVEGAVDNADGTRRPLKMAQKGKERRKLLKSILKKHQPDVLVCAGFTLKNSADCKNLNRFLTNRDWPGVVFFEVQYGSEKKGGTTKKHDKKHIAYCWADGHLTRLGCQELQTREDVNDKKTLCRFHKKLQNFKIQSNGYTFGVLTCGEIMAFPWSAGSVKPKSEIVEAWFSGTTTENPRVDIVINPTHDRMNEQGYLTAKREFLSRDGRLYITTSNWNSSKKPAQKKSWPILHSIFFDGKKIAYATASSNSSTNYEYRERSLDADWPRQN